MYKFIVILISIFCNTFTSISLATNDNVSSTEDFIKSLAANSANTTAVLEKIKQRSFLIAEKVKIAEAGEDDESIEALDRWQRENLIVANLKLQIQDDQKFTEQSCIRSRGLLEINQLDTKESATISQLFNKWCPYSILENIYNP